MATTDAQRIQYDDGGVAHYVFLRSPNTNNASSEYNINTVGVSYIYNANAEYAFQPAMCI